MIRLKDGEHIMKLGIIGSGKIVDELLSFIHELDDIQCIHISGTLRSQDKLKRLVQEHKFQRYSTNYDDLLNDHEVEVIYIAVPNHLHYEFAKKALEHHKHVIIEKPMTSNYQEAKELKDLAVKNQLFIFEAITNQYLSQYTYIKNHLHDLGDIKLVSLQFCQYSSRYDEFMKGHILPVFDYKKSGGALMDLQVYHIHFIVGLFGEPIDIQYYPHIEQHIDTSGVFILHYPHFQCICMAAKDKQTPSFNIIQGTKGSLCIESPVSLIQEVKLIKNDGTSDIIYAGHQHVMYEEWQSFIKICQNHDLKQCYKMLEQSLIVNRILTSARQKAGIIFPADHIL